MFGLQQRVMPHSYSSLIYLLNFSFSYFSYYESESAHKNEVRNSQIRLRNKNYSKNHFNISSSSYFFCHLNGGSDAYFFFGFWRDHDLYLYLVTFTVLETYPCAFSYRPSINQYIQQSLLTRNKFKQLMQSVDKKISERIKQIQPINSAKMSNFEVLYLLSNSPYIIYLISSKTDQQILKISSEEPIANYCGYFSDDILYLIVNTRYTANGGNNWIIYKLEKIRKKQKTGYEVKSSFSGNHLSQLKPMGAHLIKHQSLHNNIVLWVFEDGSLQYMVLNEENNKEGRKITTKPYRLQTGQNRQNNNKIYSKVYSGGQILLSESQSKVQLSAYDPQTKTLIVAMNNLSSFTLYQLIVDGYEVRSGSHYLLNVAQPQRIYFIKSGILLLLESGLVIWTEKQTRHIIEQPIRGLNRVSENQFTFLSGGSIKKITITSSLSAEVSNIQTPAHLLRNTLCLLLSEARLSKFMHSISPKLQVQLRQLDSRQDQILIANQSTIIKQVQLQFNDYINYLLVHKEVGAHKQMFILSHAQVFMEKEVYQHNMLLKMAKVVGLPMGAGKQGNKGNVWITSPVIGTISLQVSASNKLSTIFDISIPSLPKTFSTQESLGLLIQEPSQSKQLTSTSLAYGSHSYKISKLFDGSIDYATAGCFCGHYIAISVQQQIHVFSFQNAAAPKRHAIYCVETDIKELIDLNSVNVIGVLLWDYTFEVLKIGEGEITRVVGTENWQIQPTNSYIHSNLLHINTACFRCTILPGYMILCSSDSLHLYQPNKTVIQLFELPTSILGSCYYPVLSLRPESQDSSTLLCRSPSNQYRFLKISNKQLIKNYRELKIEVEEFIAFPAEDIIDQLLFAVMYGQYCLFACQSRIIVSNYRQASSGIKVQEDGARHIDRWVAQGKIQPITMLVEGQKAYFERIVRIGENKCLLYNQQEIWLAAYAQDKKDRAAIAEPISYFSMPNNSFLEFRNNLSVEQLQNEEFMEIFAKKLTIKAVAKINQTRFAVLYESQIIIIEIGLNQMLVINQELNFKEQLSSEEEYLQITDFVGYYDELSLYMKDSVNHRLYALKHQPEQNKYRIEFVDQLEIDEQFVCMHRVKSWKNKARKVSVQGQINTKQEAYENLIIKKDGQLIIGDSKKPIYL